MKHSVWRRTFACLLLAAIVLTPFAGMATEAIPLAQASLPATLRVLLTRLDVFTQADLTLTGVYTADIGGVTMLFPYGSEITVLVIDDALYIDYAGMRLGSGTELTLTRCKSDHGGENGIRFATSASLYEGDLYLRVQDGLIRMILTIGVEDYLLGVVPYEMSDSFPLEALKAQSVAARTYALRKALRNRNSEYDLSDTTNDQVFKGRRYEYTRTEEAVKATAGVCAFYKGNLAMCYYGSSNGGQTELVENQWGPGEDAGYMDMRDDPYDLENPKSVVKSATLYKTASSPDQTPYALRALIADALRDTLVEQGYDPAPESLRVDTIADVSVDTPKYAAPSRLYTMFHITFTYSARTRTDYTPATPGTLADEIEITLFTAVPAATDTPAPTGTPVPADTSAPTETLEPTDTPAPTATPAPVYGAFELADGEVTLTFPIFPDVEQALSLSINQYQNELFTVQDTGIAFVVESRRFGHGVGMSQYGAEWMASQYGFTYDRILAFYYPGATLMRAQATEIMLPDVSTVFTKQADPAPTATPRPTLMPVTETLSDGQWYARVSNIGDNSWLNLRAEPNLSAEILMMLYKDQRLKVLERMPQEGWLHVKTDVVEGYVMEDFTSPE